MNRCLYEHVDKLFISENSKYRIFLITLQLEYEKAKQDIPYIQNHSNITKYTHYSYVGTYRNVIHTAHTELCSKEDMRRNQQEQWI